VPTTEQTGAAPHADGPTVAIIVGSTRPGRKADTVAHWVHDIAARRTDASYEVVDLCDYNLPHLDEPTEPPRGSWRPGYLAPVGAGVVI
jgi:NAD(P)H-dependent FMN reductase